MAQITGRAVALLIFMYAFPVSADVTVARQAELRHMIDHDCGSCHGMSRKGGLGPPLTAEVLRERPSSVLFDVIRNGVADTPMPPWREILTDSEIHWIVNYLKEGT